MIVQNNKFDSQQKALNFKGLTRCFSKKIHNSEKLIEITEKYPKNNGLVGSPPFEWINQIPKTQRTEKIKQLYSAFAQAFRQPLIEPEDIKKTQKILNKAFKDSKIIKKSQNVTFELLSEEGSFGVTYNLHVPIAAKGRKDYVVKHYRSHLPRRLNSGKEFLHGNYVEQNVAFYLQNDFYNIPRLINKMDKDARKDWRKGDLPNILFSDLRNNYAVYEDANFLEKPLRHYKTQDSGIISHDRHKYNLVNGYNVDYGGYETTVPIISSNKTARSVYKRVKNAKEPLAQFGFYIKNADKLQNAKDVYAGIAAVLISVKESKIENIDLSLDQQIRLTQKIIDTSRDKIKDTVAYGFLKNHLTNLKLEQKRRDSFNIDEFLK